MDVVNEYLNKTAVISAWSLKDKKIKAASDNFVIMHFNESDQERTAIQYTFGSASLFVGPGRAPRIYSYGGALVDSKNSGKQIAHWLRMYNLYWRATSATAGEWLINLSFRDQFRKGYIVNTKLDYDASKPLIAQFSFSMFVISEGANTCRQR